MSASPFGRGLIRFFQRVNRRWRWDRLPVWPGIVNLFALRQELREKNLYDTWTPGGLRRRPPDEPVSEAQRRFRSADGSYNDLDFPDMGRAGTRFGRNVPLAHAVPEPEPALLRPSPREVSRRLLRRDVFKPAESLNLLAAAWIQFQTHDWFNHGRDHARHFELELAADDDWHERPMRIPRTPADPTRCPLDHGLPPTYINSESHWWDGSAIYGSSLEKQQRVRSHVDGKLVLENGRLPVDPETGLVSTGFNDNWWVGLGLLHTLFTLEHNAICDRLRAEHPDWDDDRLFGTARLVNSALMARIHTVEWTPAIIAHPTLIVGMRVNWFGVVEKLQSLVGRVSKSEVISGIPGCPVEHHGAPFQLTEEFAAVYRMHSLIPDDVNIYSCADDALLRELTFRDVTHEAAHRVIEGPVTVNDVWYSFGVNHPGAITLHNHPRFLLDLTSPDGVRVDLGAVDILRDRERGVPRYNQFRRLLHLEPVQSFEALAGDPRLAREIADVYDHDIERVDLQVGLHAETPPAGFGFSDTAFRVFVLMATRRLRSDRFFTDCYTAEYYTQTGLDWVARTDMRTVLLRHYPELAPALDGVPNAFAPWKRVRPSASDRVVAPMSARPALRTAPAGGKL